MNKRDYFIRALQAHTCKKREWVNHMFSVVVDNPLGNAQVDYAYRIAVVAGDSRYHYIDPSVEGGLLAIDGSDRDRPLFEFTEALTIKPGEIPNYTGTTALQTTYGRALVNYLCLVIPFDTAIPYVNGFFNIGEIEDRINTMLISDPDDPGVTTPPVGKVFVRQYLMFCEYALSLVAYNSLCVTSVSKKSLQSHPRAREMRAELAAEYHDRLDDPAIVARIGQQLETLDREWLADDPTLNFYKIKDKKLFGGVRKKLYYMFGGESPFQDGTSVEFIQKSLEEGIDIDHLPAMINSLRFGSFNRGAQTQLGGESTKTIYRMLGTVRIAEEDCGTRLGIPIEVNTKNKNRFVGFSLIEGNKSVLLTKENIDQYVGQMPALRGPLTCKTEGRNVCSVCVGKALSEQPEGLAAAAAGLGGRFLSLFLAKMHSGSLATEKWDKARRIS